MLPGQERGELCSSVAYEFRERQFYFHVNQRLVPWPWLACSFPPSYDTQRHRSLKRTLSVLHEPTTQVLGGTGPWHQISSSCHLGRSHWGRTLFQVAVGCKRVDCGQHRHSWARHFGCSRIGLDDHEGGTESHDRPWQATRVCIHLVSLDRALNLCFAFLC